MISKRQTNSPLTIQLPDMMNSVTSQGSISNFVAQTPKQNRLIMNFKRNSNPPKYNEQKQNILQGGNHMHLQVVKKNHLPYKMVTSQLPATCSNHQDKQSSFYIDSDDGELIFYCQKCAILVASQGFQVKKIQSSLKQKNFPTNNSQGGSVRFSIKETKTVKKSKADFITKQQKQTKLTNFLNNLQRIQSRIDYFYQRNESSLTEIDSIADDEGKKIKDLFSNLGKILDEMEQGYLDQLENRVALLRDPLGNFGEDLNDNTNTLESMKEDICQAYDEIINETTGTQFETVMDAYQQNTAEIEGVLDEKESQALMQETRKKLEIDIREDEVIRELQKQINLRFESKRRQSIKSIKRRISIGGNKIR